MGSGASLRTSGFAACVSGGLCHARLCHGDRVQCIAISVLQRRDDLLVLCYHAVSRTWPAQLAVTPQRLERQLRLLESRGYRGVRFSDAVIGPSRRDRRVAVTFDDGYSSVLALAKPILDELGWPATLFVPTDYIGTQRPMSWPGIDAWTGGPFENELMPLGWDDVRELQAAGWEIGSHSCSHPHLTTLSDGDLRGELLAAKDVCERELDVECLSIAYPYGDADDRVIAMAAEVGYRAGAALAERPHPACPLYWPRVGIYLSDDEARFRRRVSRGSRLLERTPAWSLANRIVHLLTSRLLPADAIEGMTPAMSLLASHGLLIRGRAGTAAVGVAGRLGVSAVHVLWPDAVSPRLAIRPAAPHTVAWMMRRFESPERRRHPASAANWSVLRARGAFVGHGAGRAVELAEAALDRTLRDAHVALYISSNSSCHKATSFVWQDGNKEPSLVVKSMSCPLHPCHLRHETEVLADLRQQLTGHRLAATLPPAPLLVGEHYGSYIVVEAVDPLGGRHSAPPRARAVGWLRAFHGATQRVRPWGPEDEATLLACTRRAYREAGISDETALCERLQAGLVSLRDAPVPLVVEHRSFWSENIAANADEMRVYGWECALLEGRPFFDLWTYELGRLCHWASAARPADALTLKSCLHRVEQELIVRGIDSAFARLTLPSVVGDLACRREWATAPSAEKGQPLQLMRAAAQLVLDS